MTPELTTQIEKWQTTCATIEGYVNDCPDLTDMDWLLKWYGEVHTHLIYLGNEKAAAEIAYKQKCAVDLKADAIPANVWQYIKGSSTVLNQYLAGINPELYGVWQRLENLARNLETILSDMRTLLVNLRQTDNRDNQTAQNQGRDERKPQPPSNGRDYVWPEVEK